jgi:hypothetical protein
MLRHISSHEGFNRTPYFRNVIKSSAIQYKKNIEKIAVIEYDTAPFAAAAEL